MIPRLLPPGWCDPRLRVFVSDPPSADDLDRIALLSSTGSHDDALKGLGGVASDEYLEFLGYVSDGEQWNDPTNPNREPRTWFGKTTTEWPALRMWDRVPEYLRPFVLSRWRQMRALGALPEDMLTDKPDREWDNWPNAGDHLTRMIFFWNFQVWDVAFSEKVYACLQVQKWDPDANDKAGGWRIFNKWGQDLTYRLDTEKGEWSTGFDAGLWVESHTNEIFTVVQLVMTALSIAVTLGASAPGMIASNLATLAAMQAAQRGAIEGLQKLQKGDEEGAAASFLQAGASLASNAPIADAFGKVAAGVGKLKIVEMLKPFTQLAERAGSFDLGKLVATAKEYGATLAAVTPETLKAAWTQIPPTTFQWFKWGNAAGILGTAEDLRAKVPWYATSAFDLAASLGTVQQAQLEASRALQASSLIASRDPGATMTFRTALSRSLQASSFVASRDAAATVSFKRALAILKIPPLAAPPDAPPTPIEAANTARVSRPAVPIPLVLGGAALGAVAMWLLYKAAR